MNKILWYNIVMNINNPFKAVVQNNARAVTNNISAAWNVLPVGTSEISYWATVIINGDGTGRVLDLTIEGRRSNNNRVNEASRYVAEQFIHRVVNTSLIPNKRLFNSIVQGGGTFHMRIYLRKRPPGSSVSTDVILHRDLVKQAYGPNTTLISAMQALWYVDDPSFGAKGVKPNNPRGTVTNPSMLAETVYVPKYTMNGAKVVRTSFRRGTHMKYGRNLSPNEISEGIVKYRAKKGRYISFIPEVGYHAVIKSPWAAQLEPSRDMILSHLFIPKPLYDNYISQILPKSSKRFRNTANNTKNTPTKIVSNNKKSARDIADDILKSNRANRRPKNIVAYEKNTGGAAELNIGKMLKEFKRSGITPLPPRIPAANNRQNTANLLTSPEYSGVFMVDYLIKNKYFPYLIAHIWNHEPYLDYYMKNFAYEIFIGYSKYIKSYKSRYPHFIMGGFATKLYVEERANARNMSNIPQRNLDQYVFNTHDIDAHTILENNATGTTLQIARDFAEYMKGFLGYLSRQPHNSIATSTNTTQNQQTTDKFVVTTDPRFEMVVTTMNRRNNQGQSLTLNSLRGLHMVGQVQARITFNRQEIFVYEFGITFDDKRLGTPSYVLNTALTKKTGLPIPTIKSLLMEQASLFYRERFEHGSGRNNTKKRKTHIRLWALLSILKLQGNSTINEFAKDLTTLYGTNLSKYPTNQQEAFKLRLIDYLHYIARTNIINRNKTMNANR